MHITYYGLSCVKIVAKTAGRGSEDVAVLFAPFDKNVGLRPPQGGADIVLVPHADAQFNNPSAVRGEPVVIDLPGEYAIKGVNIVGTDVPADPQGGAQRGNSVAFVLDIEDMRVVYLGALGGELSATQMDALVGADILFVPVGDTEGLDGKTAEVIVRKLDPKMLIPMQYKTKGVTLKTLRDEKDFCSNIGNCPKERVDKLTIKAQDLENKSMDVVMLDAV